MRWNFRSNDLPESGGRVPVWICRKTFFEVLPAIYEASIDDPDEIYWKNLERTAEYDDVYAWQPREEGQATPPSLVGEDEIPKRCPDGSAHAWAQVPYYDDEGNEVGFTTACRNCGFIGDSVGAPRPIG